MTLFSPDSSVPPDRLNGILSGVSLPPWNHDSELFETCTWGCYQMVFFLSGGRKEGPHGAFQLDSSRDFVAKLCWCWRGPWSELLRARTGRLQLPNCCPEVLAQWAFSTFQKNVPFGSYWEDLLGSLSLISNKSFCSQTLPSAFPLNTNIPSTWSHAAQGNRKAFLSPFPCLAFPSLLFPHFHSSQVSFYKEIYIWHQS